MTFMLHYKLEIISIIFIVYMNETNKPQPIVCIGFNACQFTPLFFHIFNFLVQ